MRTTKKQVESNFEYMCKALSKSSVPYIKNETTGKYECQVGAWSLDHNSTYGRYIVEEMYNDGGGVSHPLISHRLKGDAFIDLCNTVIATIRIIKGN